MDILLQLQSARKNRTFYVCVEKVPVSTLMHAFVDLDFAKKTLYVLPHLEEELYDCFYIAGFVDRSFCNRKVVLSVSYDSFYCQACGPGE